MKNKQPEHAQDQTQIILDSIADGVFTVDKEWIITSFNQAAEKITGISRIDAIGRHCWEIFRAGVCESKCSLRETMESGQPVVNRSIHIINSEGENIPVSISTALLKDQHGRIYGGVETFRDLSQIEELQKELQGRHSFMDIISKNRTMHKLFGILPQIAESDSTVLIQGESGTGKELFARAIHALSHRKRRPLVTINCGALPDTLLESELFGYKAGAFTDAKKDKPGRLALADGGTLFLDEVGDVSPALQIKLLRVLQEKTFEPLGGTSSIRANVRILAATNHDLKSLVKKGTFRQDFYYRINVVVLELPPLCKRKEDIPLLVDNFVRRLRLARGKDISQISTEVLGILMRYDFPGNIRELENIIEHAYVICPGGVIAPEHLPSYLAPADASGDRLIKPRLASGSQSLKEIEKLHIIELLRKNNWNRIATAKELGIHKATLWRKIRKLEIQVADLDGRSRL